MEVRALRRAGIETIVFELGQAEQNLIAGEWMSRRNVSSITLAAYDAASGHLDQPGVREALARADLSVGRPERSGRTA